MQGQDNKAWTLDQHTQLLSSEGHLPRGQNLVSHVALKVKPDSIYIYIYIKHGTCRKRCGEVK